MDEQQPAAPPPTAGQPLSQPTAAPPPPPPAATRKHRRRFLIAAAGLIIIAAAVFFWANSSDQGKITAAAGQKPTVTAAYKTFNSQYMAFRYKGEYAVQKMSASGQNLAVYMFKADTDYLKEIAVSVSRAPNGWQSDSAYLYRQSQPDIYSQQPVTVAGSQGVIWTKNDGTEETVMLPRNGTIATLSFTSSLVGGPANGLDPEVRALLATFQWK